MASNINTDNINSNFPVQGEDNPSQGFRDNFNFIKIALATAAEEITELQESPVGVTIATTTETGVVRVGSGLSVDNAGTLAVNNILPSYDTASVLLIPAPTAGLTVFVTDAPGGAQPCFYDGTNWFTISGRIQL